LRLIPVEEILFFQSDEKYTRVQTATYEALIRKPVRDLAEELDPALFWQIHRSTLVNAKAISGVVRDLRGRHLVQVKGSNEKLEVSAASFICSNKCKPSFFRWPPCAAGNAQQFPHRHNSSSVFCVVVPVTALRIL
jgi:hypothetical protein